MKRYLKAIKHILFFPIDVWELFVTYLPGKIGQYLRYHFWKRRLQFLGINVQIDSGTYFQNPQFISIDDNCWIDRGVIILAGPDKGNRHTRKIHNRDYPIEKGRVYIGKYAHISPYCILSGISGIYFSDYCSLSANVKIYSFSHHYRSEEFKSDRSFIFSPRVDHERQFMIEGPIYLGNNVGIALNSVILPGVSISKDSFVGINSVVFSSFGENSLIAGNPAKRIRDRFEDPDG